MELGYRGSGDTLKREEFESRKKAIRERNTQKTTVPKQLASAGKNLKQVRVGGTKKLKWADKTFT